jgi:hypothetical protein
VWKREISIWERINREQGKKPEKPGNPAKDFEARCQPFKKIRPGGQALRNCWRVGI